MQVYINGYLVPVYSGQPAITENGRTFVPVRAVVETMGAEVCWNDTTSEVTIKFANKVVVLKMDSTTTFVDGKPQKIDAPPFMRRGRTLVPLRFICETFDAKIEWDDATNSVKIFKPGRTVMGLIRNRPLNEAVVYGTKVASWTIQQEENICPGITGRLKEDVAAGSINKTAVNDKELKKPVTLR